jgi:hypothetical protein
MEITILFCFQVVAFTSLGAVVVSTICFILSTFPELQEAVKLLFVIVRNTNFNE